MEKSLNSNSYLLKNEARDAIYESIFSCSGNEQEVAEAMELPG